MAQAILNCPKCGSELIRDYGDKQKLRTNILIFERGKCTVKCPNCKGNVDVPITLNLTLPTAPVKKKLKHVIMSVDRN